MQILKISWRNFNSYGNRWNEIDLSSSDNSFIMIAGISGVGKSTISDVLKFGLYGKVNNKKLRDIPNRLNKACEVEIHLKSNGHNVCIKRGLEPSYFKVEAEGFSQIDQQSGKLNIQDVLESEILGMPFYVFNNIISLSINDFKSFIKMNPSDKRGIIDKVIGLSIINKMYEALKLDIKTVVESDNALMIQNSMLNSQLEHTTSQLENISKKLLESSAVQSETIATKIQTLLELRRKIKKLYDEQSAIVSEFSEKINDNKSSVQDAKYALKNILNSVKLYENEKCPECGSDLHTEFHNDKLLTLNDKKEFLLKKIKGLQEVIVTELENKEEIEEEQSELKTKLQKIDTNNAILKDQLAKIKDNSFVEEQTELMQSAIKDTTEKLLESKTLKQKSENKLQFLKIVEDALSDKGLKQLAIKTILPTVNTTIHQLMNELNLEFKLSFTEEWNPIITHLGQEINPETLSTGENKKLDMAVIISIIKLMKFKFPGLNVLFLDEVLSSLDADSATLMLQVLSKISKQLNLHVFVINHAPVDGTKFDGIITIEKSNGFSNAVFTKTE